MSDLKVCRICLRTEAKMYHYNLYQLKFYYEEVMAIQVNEMDSLPQHFCYECATILHKFHKFKEKCFRGQKILRNLLWRGPITYESVYKVDRNDTLLTSTVTVITSTERIKTYIVKDSKDEEVDELETKVVENIENIELDYLSEASMTDREDSDQINDLLNAEKINEKLEYKIGKEKINKELELIIGKEKISEELEHTIGKEKIKIGVEKKDLEHFSPAAVYVESEKGIMNVKCEEIKERKKPGNEKRFLKIEKKLLDSKYWKIFNLSEEEALENFRARTADRKYLQASFKCTDCFKGFSKQDMLERHIQLRHVKSLGPYECRFCRMRFKLNCDLRKHLRQHYTKFECLRCHLVCPLEYSALLHDEYHSGVKRKCIYCNEEFRHSSTYYTHLRTHRSEHVCTLCGASFVSTIGLQQHKRIKHVINDIESPDDDEEVNTYCERCDIRFETRKAYEEHLFHSALHSEGEGNDTQENNKKVLGKKEQAKITKQLRKRSTDEDVFKTSNGHKRKKRTRRNHRKPMTCHQCGKHFDTQAACWKHHLAEHPRTSFYAPTERYICEICGSSLAPGSVATHQNMHTREKLYTCDTCGRQFHAIIGLKRHLVTHTGEKPYACSLCDKRFTQSNSMKLHYRTFHLKQPYPKRIRRKNKGDPKTGEERRSEDSNSEEDSDDSLPDIEPKLPERGAGIEPVPDAVPDKPSDESMHYLTLT